MRCRYCDIEGKMYRYILASGAVTVTQRCPVCGISTGEKLFFPRKDFPDYEELPLYKDNTIDSEPCCVTDCGRKDTQFHHFAPKHLFDDYDNWPTGYLCTYHHQLWHELTWTGSYIRRRNARKVPA